MRTAPAQRDITTVYRILQKHGVSQRKIAALTDQSQSEVSEIIVGKQSAFRRNLRGRAATHIATGRTEAGRRLTVAFIYLSAARTAVPINAWENR